MFLREIKSKRKSGKVYSYWVVVKTFWDKEKKKVRHKVIHNLGILSEREVKVLKTLFSLRDSVQESFLTHWQDIKVKSSYEFLIVVILDRIWRFFELDKITESNDVSKVPYSLISEILVLNRAICPSSDIKVCEWYKETILPYLFKIEPSLVNPTRIYRCLDVLFRKERQIQQYIGKKIETLGFDNLSLVFYDITSSYFEGSGCSLAEYGLSRDHREDKKQLLLALGLTKQGFPFYWKVLPGGIHDASCVCEAVNCFKEEYGMKNFIVIMDKGMVSSQNIEFLEKNGLYYIVSIKRNQIKKLSDFPVSLIKEIGEKIEKEKLDMTNLMRNYPYFTYFSDRAYYRQLNIKGKRRYILCFNPEKLLEERRQRQEKIDSIIDYFRKWNNQLLKARYTKDKKSIEKEIYAYLKKRKAENYFNIELVSRKEKIKKRNITTYQIKFNLNNEKLEKIKLLDGVWCLLTNIPEDKLPDFLISSYIQRRKVEEAFHYLKGFIEIRPFYHHKEERVKAHILVCVLSYLLQRTLEYLLKKSGYNLTFREFLQKVKSIKAVELEIKSIKKNKIKLTEIPEEIKKLLKDLKNEDMISDDFLKKFDIVK